MTTQCVPALESKGVSLGGGQTAVMGILNVTPDSFSDGGLWMDPVDAVGRGQQMWKQGALIIDVGGESTRPGARRVTPGEEWERVAPVVAGLAERGVPVSIDTVNASTAKAALELGAVLVNDVSGGRHDPRMAKTCAAAGAAMVVQHWRGFPSDPTLNLEYGDVVSEVITETMEQVGKVLAEGVPPKHVVVDPGLGFGLKNKDSWVIAESLASFVSLGFPVLVGASRKRFIAERFGDRLESGTSHVTMLAALAGAWAVRVHDVEASVALLAGVKEAGRNDDD